MSTLSVARFKWQAIVATLVATGSVVVAVVAISLSGIGDTTYGWRIADDNPSLAATTEFRDLHVWSLESPPAPPLYFEAHWQTDARPTGTWGLWLRGADGSRHSFIIDDRGYISTSAERGWQPFIHVASSSNRLSLELDRDGSVVWQVNHEVAWSTQVSPGDALEVGLLLPAGHAPADLTTSVYTR